jgi:alkylation response protein AidB-like acyl-CoA dehydrogenase
MDFRFPANAESFRAEARQFVAEHATHEVVERAYRTGTMHDWGLHRALGERGFLAGSWPEADGGQGRSVFEMMVLLDELNRAGAPLDGWVVTMSAANTIRILGTEEQRRTVLPAVVAGEALIAIGFSEPDSGSDVASARTKAVQDGDEWIINGQKMFTTMAHEARWVFLLTRTDPEVPKHLGLTVFLVPLDSPGIEVQAVHTLGWERTNITFYTDVRVDDRWRVGHVNGGWDVILASLAFERGSEFGAGSSFLGVSGLVLDGAVRWALEAHGVDRLEEVDTLTRERIGRAATEYEVACLLNYRSNWLAEAGHIPDTEGAMAKLFASESLQRSCSDLLDLVGVDGVRQFGDPDAPAGGELEHAYRHATVTTIYGGSSEIMRGIIARRALGLPRS